MKTKSKSFLMIIALALAAAMLACQIGGSPAEPAQATPPPASAQNTPTQVESEPAVPTEAPAPTSLPATEIPPQTEAPPPPTEAPPPAPAAGSPARCAEEMCIQEGSFLLQRPVGEGGRQTYETSTRFGEYQRSTRRANLGSKFLNSTGAPVVAAADGKVIVAGDDSQTAYSQRLNEYGKLVILEHSLAGIAEPVYTLYAHLSEVLVNEGDSVSAGQEIGKVGMSGNVGGSILHFEVRQGENKPENAVNPELWLSLMSDEEGQQLGALAGSVVDADGEFIELPNIVLEHLAGPGQPALDQYYLKTYSDKDLTGRDPYGENFAAGDLPAGTYQISIWLGQMHQKIVEIEPGKLTLVNFQIK